MKICYNCFNDIPDSAKTCPHCGSSADLRNEDKYPHALPCGAVLDGRYIVGRVLGQGGFGITYAGQQFDTKELVAIKEYFPGVLASRNASRAVVPVNSERTGDFEYGEKQFLDEARTLAAFIGSPNIVRVHSYFEENGTAYFVMEYVRGKSLKQYVESRGGRISWEETWDLLMPVLEALSEVHSKKIIHRDIKPDNIIITEEGSAKLIDFGAARYRHSEKSRSLTAVLTPGYAPPEQYYSSGDQGAWTDVYALAATMYFSIMGMTPPESIGRERASSDSLEKPSSLGIAIPAYAEAALLKALSVKEKERYETTYDFRNAVLEGKRREEKKGDVKSPPADRDDIIFNETQKKAAGGDADSQFLLGFFYEKGKGTARDDQEAEKWYRLAAAQGNAEARMKLDQLTSRNGDVPDSGKKDPVKSNPVIRIKGEAGQFNKIILAIGIIVLIVAAALVLSNRKKGVENEPETTTETAPGTITETTVTTTEETAPGTITEAAATASEDTTPETTTEALATTTEETIPEPTTEALATTTEETTPETTTETTATTTEETTPEMATETTATTTEETTPETATEALTTTTTEAKNDAHSQPEEDAKRKEPGQTHRTTDEPVELTDTWEEIVAAGLDGTYKERYRIGDTKELDMESEGIITMKLVAMDEDELADGSGKAPMTWVADELLNSKYNMNSRLTNEGGWAESGMRAWLRKTVLPLMPEEVRNNIREVTKYSYSSDEQKGVASKDTIWIPSAREVFLADKSYWVNKYLEKEGVSYTSVFTDDEVRKRSRDGESGSPRWWWLRSAISGSSNDVGIFFAVVYSDGDRGFVCADDEGGVVVGFCLGESVESSDSELVSRTSDEPKTLTDTWEEIAAAGRNGTYKEKYRIGDTKELDMGSEGIITMKLVAMDEDELADGSGKAPMTWVADECLQSRHNMNSEATNEGGWEASKMRAWLRETVLPLMPEEVRNNIREVTKYSYSHEEKKGVTSKDTIWIPSMREVFYADHSEDYWMEETGAAYTSIFINDETRKRGRDDESGASRSWWLRSASFTFSFIFGDVYSNDDTIYIFNATAKGGVVVGFCF